jgi:hypothetical protein
MPIPQETVGTSGTAPQKEEKLGQILIRRLRAFLRDHAVLNELIEGKESSNEQLRDALLDAIDDWNITQPPLAPVNIRTHPSQRLLIRGAAIEILFSAGILQDRNRLDYNDGGIVVRDKDKGPAYAAWIARLVNDYETKKINKKKTDNMNLAFGFIPSEYSGNNRNSEEFF